MKYIHALVLTFFLISFSVVSLAIYLYHTCSRAVAAEACELHYRRDVEASAAGGTAPCGAAG